MFAESLIKQNIIIGKYKTIIKLCGKQHHRGNEIIVKNIGDKNSVYK